MIFTGTDKEIVNAWASYASLHFDHKAPNQHWPDENSAGVIHICRIHSHLHPSNILGTIHKYIRLGSS